jgi:hypothetical protein
MGLNVVGSKMTANGPRQLLTKLMNSLTAASRPVMLNEPVTAPPWNPAQYWRHILTQFRGPYDGDDPDAYWHRIIEGEYERAKANAERSLLFFSACGLLTYGRLDVVADLLNNVPAGRRSHSLESCVKAILPLPKALRDLDDPIVRRAVISWVNDNRDSLIWEDEKGAFSLAGQ